MTHATLIANAGILLEINGIRFLIDGLHHSSQYPFSPVPQAMLDQMLRGEGPFRDADFLLFTHDHPDHWSPALTQAYLQANRVRRVLLPPRSKDGPAQDALTADMTARQTAIHPAATCFFTALLGSRSFRSGRRGRLRGSRSSRFGR